MSLHKPLIAVFLFFLSQFSFAQTSEDYVLNEKKSSHLTERKCRIFTIKAKKKCDRCAQKIHKTTDNYYQEFEAIEENILRIICDSDERHAESLMRGSLYSFRRLESMKVRKISEPLGAKIPELDSLNWAADFLSEHDTQSRKKKEMLTFITKSTDHETCANHDDLMCCAIL